MGKQEEWPNGEFIAEHRDGIALTSALALDRRALIESWQFLVKRATAQPRAVADVAGSLLGRYVVEP